VPVKLGRLDKIILSCLLPTSDAHVRRHFERQRQLAANLILRSVQEKEPSERPPNLRSLAAVQKPAEAVQAGFG
jgi:hypothetical protein